MKVIVSTDSTSDLPKDLQEKYNIYVMPLIVTLGEKSFEDGVDISAEDIFDYVDKTNTLPKTGAKSAFLYQEFFENIFKKENADAIILISLSDKLSSSYSNAVLASNELKNVYVIDSKSLSSGSGLIALSCADKINEGKDVQTIIKELNDEIEKTQASFIVDSLKYLHKGGRCSALSVLGANLLRIKPKIKLEDGKMGVDRKYMGKYESVLISYTRDLLKDYKNINKKRVFVTFTTKNDEVNEKIIAILKENGFEEIIENFAGSTITCHCGKNTLGVLFINN